MDARYTRLIVFGIFVGAVVCANLAVTIFGVIPIGFGLMAPAGVFFAGWGFTNRDWLQRVWSKSAVIVAILCGALLSAVFSPGLALASATAFLLSELLDFAVYTPLQSRNWLLAVTLSNTIGAAVDSAVFLVLAFGSLDFFLGQFVGKSYVTLIFVVCFGVYRVFTTRYTFKNANW